MDVGIRRVGFRLGTDTELAAMHMVESEIESERWPGNAPQPLDWYMRFARSLPSQFDDHTWLAEDQDGAPIGCAACWSNSDGDPAVMESYVYVRKPWRNQGVGWKLAAAIVNEARAEARKSLLWATYSSIAAGEAFSRRLGATPTRINRTSDLRMADVDWEMVRSWIDACRGENEAIRWNSSREPSRRPYTKMRPRSITSCKQRPWTICRSPMSCWTQVMSPNSKCTW